MQSRCTVVAPGVDIGPFLNQQFGSVDSTEYRCDQQRCAAPWLLLGINVFTCIQKRRFIASILPLAAAFQMSTSCPQQPPTAVLSKQEPKDNAVARVRALLEFMYHFPFKSLAG